MVKELKRQKDVICPFSWRNLDGWLRFFEAINRESATKSLATLLFILSEHVQGLRLDVAVANDCDSNHEQRCAKT
jgi:hypothetical protein